MHDWRCKVMPLQECSHTAILATVEPAVKQMITDEDRAIKFQECCPDCWWVLDVRLWPPVSGGWYLRLQERLAAGRQWYYRREGDRWIAGT